MITRTGQWRCCTNKSPNQRRTTFGTQLDATGLPLFQYRRIAGIFLESVLAWKSYTISCLLLQQIIGFQKKPRKACAFVASKSTVYIDGVACRLCHICHVPRFTLCRGPLRGLASAWQFGAGLGLLVSQSQGHDIEAILLWISVDNFLLLKTHKAVSALFLLIGVRILQPSERGRLTSDVTGSQFWNQKLYVLSTSQQKWISALLAEQTFH